MDWTSWKPWSVVVLIIVAIFAIYSFAATNRDAAGTAVPTVRAVAAATRNGVAAPGVGKVHMEWLEAQSGSYKSERNLFAYKEPPPPPPPQPRVVATPVVVQPPPPPPQPPQPEAPVPPSFPYHFIGTFGMSSNPIATFSGNGQIVNARAGETIDGKFVLRGIGIESVEIGYVGFPPNLTKRIPLG